MHHIHVTLQRSLLSSSLVSRVRPLQYTPLSKVSPLRYDHSAFKRSFSDESLKSKHPFKQDKGVFESKKKKISGGGEDGERAETMEEKMENQMKPPPPDDPKITMDGLDVLSEDSLLQRRVDHDPLIKKDYNLNRFRGLAIFCFVLAVVAFINEWSEDAEKRRDWRKKSNELIVRNWEIELLSRLPLRLVSRVWGWITHTEIPVSWRESIYKRYAKAFGCNLSEMRDPLASFPTFADFFARKLKDGARPLGSGFICPVDGTVLHFGEIDGDSMEQVKGIRYSLKAFLGEHEEIKRYREERKVGKKLYHCIIYLAPGDYHGVHSPVDFKVTETTHFPGTLFPVKPSWASLVQGLFSLNERVALTGTWEHGFFSLTPVGATNVGSIVLSFDKELKTNRWFKPRNKELLQKRYVNDQVISLNRGDEVAFFHMGSTVVLIFESPEFMFHISKGQKVRLGETLGQVIPEQWRPVHVRPKVMKSSKDEPEKEDVLRNPEPIAAPPSQAVTATVP